MNVKRVVKNLPWPSSGVVIFEGPWMYTVTLVRARYGGSYEGSEWLAFPVLPRDMEIFDGWDGSDVECSGFWLKANDWAWPLGHGKSPDEAYANLLERLLRWDEEHRD